MSKRNSGNPTVKTLKPRLRTLQTEKVKGLAETQRLRGSGLQKVRRQQYQSNPLCAACLKMDPPRYRYGSESDHITPLWAGGAESILNRQLLCFQCHAEKTAREAQQRAAAEL